MTLTIYNVATQEAWTFRVIDQVSNVIIITYSTIPT